MRFRPQQKHRCFEVRVRVTVRVRVRVRVMGKPLVECDTSYATPR